MRMPESHETGETRCQDAGRATSWDNCDFSSTTHHHRVVLNPATGTGCQESRKGGASGLQKAPAPIPAFQRLNASIGAGPELNPLAMLLLGIFHVAGDRRNCPDGKNGGGLVGLMPPALPPRSNEEGPADFSPNAKSLSEGDKARVLRFHTFL